METLEKNVKYVHLFMIIFSCLSFLKLNNSYVLRKFGRNISLRLVKCTSVLKLKVAMSVNKIMVKINSEDLMKCSE